MSKLLILLIIIFIAIVYLYTYIKLRKKRKNKTDSKIGFINKSKIYNSSLIDEKKEESKDLRVDYISKEDFISEIQAELHNKDNKKIIKINELKF